MNPNGKINRHFRVSVCLEHNSVQQDTACFFWKRLLMQEVVYEEFQIPNREREFLPSNAADSYGLVSNFKQNSLHTFISMVKIF